MNNESKKERKDCYELTANAIALLNEDSKNAEQALLMIVDAIENINNFIYGLLISDKVKNNFSRELPLYAEKMFTLSATFDDMLFAANLFLQYDAERAKEVLFQAEIKAESSNAYVNIASIAFSIDKELAKRFYSKAEKLANDFESYFALIDVPSHFYQLPDDFLDRQKVNQGIAKAASFAKSADDMKKLSGICYYFSEKLNTKKQFSNLKPFLTEKKWQTHIIPLKTNFSNKSTIGIFRLFPELISPIELYYQRYKLLAEGYTRLYYINLFPEYKNLCELCNKQDKEKNEIPETWKKYISELLIPHISHIRFGIDIPENIELQDCIKERMNFVKSLMKEYGLKEVTQSEKA